MFERPPKTAASSVIELETVAIGSLKWRERCERKYEVQPCEPCTNGSVLSKPSDDEHRAERLARLAGVDDDALAGEVQLAVLVGLRPRRDAIDLALLRRGSRTPSCASNCA